MSLMFLNRAHTVFKIIVEIDRMVKILLWFYNLVIRNGIVLDRQRNILDTMIEKGKRCVLEKANNNRIT